jgi:hypothetical protein
LIIGFRAATIPELGKSRQGPGSMQLTWNYSYFAVDPNTWLGLEVKTPNADPTLQSYYQPSNLYKWCSDQIPADPHAATNPAMDRVIATSVIRATSPDGDAILETWWIGDLYYRGVWAGPGGHAFRGVLASRDEDDPWHSPARVTVRVPRHAHPRGWLQIEGPGIPGDYADGAYLGD